MATLKGILVFSKYKILYLFFLFIILVKVFCILIQNIFYLYKILCILQIHVYVFFLLDEAPFCLDFSYSTLYLK